MATSKNSRSSRKAVATHSYKPRKKEKKQYIWLEAGSPRQQEVHKISGILETKWSYGKEYFKYANPAVDGVGQKAEDQ